MNCSVDVTLIILDDENGAPLSGSQALVLLDETQSLVALMSAGLTANEFETSGKEVHTYIAISSIENINGKKYT